MVARVDPPLLHSPLSATLAIAVAAALLLAFGLVVQENVRQAELRHIEAGAQAEAVWRCAWSKDDRERDDCQNAFRVRRVASVAILP